MGFVTSVYEVVWGHKKPKPLKPRAIKSLIDSPHPLFLVAGEPNIDALLQRIGELEETVKNQKEVIDKLTRKDLPSQPLPSWIPTPLNDNISAILNLKNKYIF